MPSRKKNVKSPRPWNLNHNRDFLLTSQSNSIFHPTAKEMSTAGRDASHTFRDLRSSSVPHKRSRKAKWKYYNFSVVKPGQVSQAHYHPPPVENGPRYWNIWPAGFDECEVVALNKRQLYEEAQHTAPIFRHKHHRCQDKSRKEMKREAGRQEALAKFEAREWDKFGCYKDFDLRNNTEDWWFYDEMGYFDAEDLWWNTCVCWAVIDGDFDFCPLHPWDYEKEERDNIEGAVVDFELLVEDAMGRWNEQVRKEFEQQGWSDIGSDAVLSPEVDWLNDEEIDEDFEMI